MRRLHHTGLSRLIGVFLLLSPPAMLKLVIKDLHKVIRARKVTKVLVVVALLPDMTNYSFSLIFTK